MTLHASTAFARSRVDHVGSLLRPEGLKAAFRSHAEGRTAPDALRAAQDAAIREVILKQEQHGLPAVTDGEFRRLNWQVSFSAIEGWDLWGGSWRNFLRYPGNRAPAERPLQKGEDAVVSFRAPATARLKLVRSFPLEEYRFARSAASGPVKITLMGPDRVRQMCDLERSRAAYPDPDAFLGDVVTLERMRAAGEDPLRSLERAVAADNAVIAGLGGRAVFGLHVCRGNRASMWHREGEYDAIAEALFGGLEYDRLLLEYDTERAGSFAPLRFARKGAIAVLGLITTKTSRVETVDELARRIDDASRHLPLENLALSPQCGFASGIAGNLLTEDDQWRKLDVMLETAKRVWGTG
jgi:5-methyltetrahydropteroyltriglutamate--homocysteine methyltransferase